MVSHVMGSVVNLDVVVHVSIGLFDFRCLLST